jgi:hypothetical protein
MARFPRGFGLKVPLGIRWDNSLADKLVSAILLNEGGGLHAVDSVWGLQGILSGSTGAPSWSPVGNSLGGRGGQGLRFNQANSQIVTYDGTRYLNLQAGAMTVMGWLVLDGGQNNGQYVFSKTDSNQTGGWIVTANNASSPGIIFEVVLSGSNHVNGTDPSNVLPQAGKLFQFACTWNFATKTSQIFINGIGATPSTSGSGIGTETGNHNLTIGTGVFGGSNFFGSLAERFYLWSRVLSPTEILALYYNPNALHQPARRYVPGSGAAAPGTIDGTGFGRASSRAFGSPGFIGGSGDQFIIGTGDGRASSRAFGTGAVAGGNTIVGSSGRPSSRAFGGPGLIGSTNQIVGSYGRPSSRAFGTGATITEKPFTLIVAGQDVTKQMRVNTLDIVNSISQISTAAFTLGGQTKTGPLLTYQVGDPVYIYQGTTRIFGGTIDSCYNTFLGVDSTEGPNLYQITCSDFSEILDRRYVAAQYNQSGDVFDLVAIVTDIVDTYLLQDGITYDASSGNNESLAGFGVVTFSWITARQAFQQLADLVNWDFSVDYYGVLRFFPSDDGSGLAPYNIADNDGNWESNPPMTVQQYRTNYRNKQGVQSSSQTTALWTDTFSTVDPGPYPSSPQAPDGLRRFFVTLYEIQQTPYVYVNGGSPQVCVPVDQIGSLGPDAWQWYYIPGSFGVQQNPAQPVLTSGDVLTVQYQGPLPPIIWVECAEQIAIRAAIEGNSGVYEDVESVTGITDPNELIAYAQGLLNRYGCLNGMPVEVIYTTHNPLPLFAGMVQNISVTNPSVPSAGFILVQVEIKDVDGKFLRTTVTADSGMYQLSSGAYYQALVNRGQLAQPSNRNTYTWQLSPTIPGQTNPGLGTGTINPIQGILASSEVPLYFTITFPSLLAGPSGPNVQMQLNGAVYGNSLVIPLTPGTYAVYFPTQAFPQGTSLQPLFGGGPSGITDGVLTLVTSVIRN